MNDVKYFLADEIKDEFDTLQELPRGSEEHSRAVEDISKLCKALAEIEKVEKDSTKEEIRKEFEDRMRTNESRFDQAIAMLTLALNAWNTVYGYRFDRRAMLEAMEFEKTGMIRGSNKPLFNFKPRRRK